MTENNKIESIEINTEIDSKEEVPNQDEKKISNVSTSTITSCNSLEHSGLFSIIFQLFSFANSGE